MTSHDMLVWGGAGPANFDAEFWPNGLLSSSIATPVLSSTASLAQPPGAPRVRARARAITPTPEPESVPVPAADSRRSPSPQQQQQQQPQQQGWNAPLVSGAGLKADLAFGQACLRDLIRQYQGQAA